MSEDIKSLERKLNDEGFLHTYIWQDGPNENYPDHAHSAETAHIVLEGEMTVTRTGVRKRTRPASAATFAPPRYTRRAWDPMDAAIW